MSLSLLLLSMIFMHIFDDFVLQCAFLSNGKQKDWWAKQTDDPKYKNDYIVCLFAHAFSWTFCMMSPLFIFHNTVSEDTLIIIFFINVCVHALCDDLKANYKLINLVVDQSIHIIQIIITFLIFIM